MIKKFFLLSLLSKTLIFNSVKTKENEITEYKRIQSNINYVGTKNELENLDLETRNLIDINYLNSKEELKDYIIGTDDEIFLQISSWKNYKKK